MTEKKKPVRKRSFKPIIRFFQIVAALMLVFFASFFISLALKSTHPSDYLFSYVEDIIGTSKNPDDKKSGDEKISDDEKNLKSNKISDDEKSDDDKKDSDKKKSGEKNSEPNKNLSDEKKSPEQNKDAGFFENISRLGEVEEKFADKKKSVRHYVKLEDMPQSFVRAIIAVEDSRFYSHSGFDLGSIARATAVNFGAGKIEEGASTITQQLVKNLFLSPEQTFTRKIEELIFAVNIERKFSKDQILEMYLNTIYFGSNFYGIYDAAHGYFGKEPKDLSPAESAMLAGLPNAPSLYSPYVDFKLAKKRQLVVIDALIRDGKMTEQEAENARIEEIVLAAKKSGRKNSGTDD